jgi:hypothetical protein
MYDTWYIWETHPNHWQRMGRNSLVVLEGEIEARGGASRGSDQYTSMQGMQHTASRQDLSGSRRSSSVSGITRKRTWVTHFVLAPPIFFMNIITSDSSNWIIGADPIVSCMLPYTCATAVETKSPSTLETFVASRSILRSSLCALEEALLKSFRKSTI